MKQVTLVIILFCLTHNYSNAQINAITSSGDEVMLHENGTWEYARDVEIEEKQEIKLNPKKFSRNKKSNFLVKSKKVNIGVYIDSKIWSFEKAAHHDSAELQFKKREDDLYGMLITEKLSIPLETLRGIALENGKSAAPDLKVVKEEYRKVNGIKVLMMQMEGTIQGLKFTYYGYYYSNENGTIQLLLYTGTNLVDDYLEEIALLLNGLVEL
jgi:hypothetical protein